MSGNAETHPRTIGKYVLLRKLATGGMGEVYLAKLEGPFGFVKLVVIKRILPHHIQDRSFVEMFFSEARVAAHLTHSNIAQIYEMDECDGSFFIAMEFVHGKSLHEMIERARQRVEHLPPHLVIELVGQLCEGLSYAHSARDLTGGPLGVVHRDVHPRNILVTYNGEVKLIDFGIAKSQVSTHHTQQGTIKGMFSYMSPEQSAAQPLDRRSDVFSVGICLYETLSLSSPFARENAILSLAAIQGEQPKPLAEFDRTLAPFDPIVAKALAKKAENRYQECSQLREALLWLLDTGQVPRMSTRLAEYVRRSFSEQMEAETKELAEISGVHSESLGGQTAELSQGDLTRLQERAQSDGGPVPVEPVAEVANNDGRLPAAPTRSYEHTVELPGSPRAHEPESRASQPAVLSHSGGHTDPARSGRIDVASSPGGQISLGIGPFRPLRAVAGVSTLAALGVVVFILVRHESPPRPQQTVDGVGGEAPGLLQTAAQKERATRELEAQGEARAAAAGIAASRPDIPGETERSPQSETKPDEPTTPPADSEEEPTSLPRASAGSSGRTPEAGKRDATCSEENWESCREDCDHGVVESCGILVHALAEGRSIPVDAGGLAGALKEPCAAGRRAACRDLGRLFGALGQETTSESRRLDFVRKISALESHERGLKSRESDRETQAGGEAEEITQHYGRLYRVLCDSGGRRACAHVARLTYLGACQTDDGAACLQLGDWHHNGQGGRKNPESAAPYYRKACELGFSKGCLYLGVLLEIEKQQRDLVAALHYYKQACKAGIPLGCSHAERLDRAKKGR